MRIAVLLLALDAATLVAAASLASTEPGKSPGTAAGRTVSAGPDGPDILIREGTIIATAADYAMDGTMWVTFTRLEDSTTYLYRSTNHGLSWEYRASVRCGAGMVEKLGLVVGEGDSAFAHVFYLDPAENGNLWELRVSCVNDSIASFPVCIGRDTIRDFAVCRDYTGSNYWLYAAATNHDPITNSRALRFLRSATYGREWAVTDSYAVQVRDPHLSAGAGSYLHFASQSEWQGGSVHMWTNDLFLNANHWVYGICYSDSDEVADPVIASSFTMPESAATVWCLWSQNYQNSGDWDIKYSYMAGVGQGWSAPAYLAGSTQADEQFPDLRSYTSPGNQYINASYISDDNVYRSVYRRHAHAATPDQWSDTLRINEGSAGTGSETRPKLSYTPGGPFTGAGCVFAGAGLNGTWWNAPYPASIDGAEGAAAAPRLDVRPRIGHGPFHIRSADKSGYVTIHDRAGRRIRALDLQEDGRAVWDGRDASGAHVTSGVYFVRVSAGEPRQNTKIVVR
ncbi:MAG: FlgD immunoglobulin-like domain containing protein [bacterium]